MERVYLHLASGGADGRSPHLPVDVVEALRDRGADAHLLGVSHGVSPTGGPRIHLHVDDVPVCVDEHMAGNGSSCAVRFDATCVVPAYEPDVSRAVAFLDPSQWPKTADEVTTLVGHAVTFAPYTVRCVSERAVAEAVLTYVGISKKIWPQEEEEAAASAETTAP